MFVTPFLGAYLALAVVALWRWRCCGAHRVSGKKVAQRASANGGRPLSVIARQPAFIVATGAGALGYWVMNLLMAATPLAMQHHGLPFADAAFVLEWHVIGMFAPGFFNGHLIKSVSACCPSWAGAPRSIWSASGGPFRGGAAPFHGVAVPVGCGWNIPVHRQHTTLSLSTIRSRRKTGRRPP
ncbi:hypothetical protein ACL7CM_01980 [Bordetella pertussis]|uniref:hypothetical protein n=1 Tax=Bordetella pertussis TaxID=520 RepID=UPI0039B77264